jgi:hypothetical protein
MVPLRHGHFKSIVVVSLATAAMRERRADDQENCREAIEQLSAGAASTADGRLK